MTTLFAMLTERTEGRRICLARTPGTRDWLESRLLHPPHKIEHNYTSGQWLGRSVLPRTQLPPAWHGLPIYFECLALCVVPTYPAPYPLLITALV